MKKDKKYIWKNCFRLFRYRISMHRLKLFYIAKKKKKVLKNFVERCKNVIVVFVWKHIMNIVDFSCFVLLFCGYCHKMELWSVVRHMRDAIDWYCSIATFLLKRIGFLVFALA